MDSAGKLTRCGSLHPLRVSLPPPRTSALPNAVSFRTAPSPSPSPLKFRPVRASASDSQTPGPMQTLKSVFKSAAVTLSAAAALFLFHLQPRPVMAAQFDAPTVDPTDQSSETNAGESASNLPNDVEALRSLMEEKIKSRKLQEAIEIIDRLIELEPEEKEWPLLKGNIYSNSGDFELAKREFEAVLEKDPDRVEAYHGLVMAGPESGKELKTVIERIKAAIERCRKQKKYSDVRDFKLLLAQVRVMEGAYVEALKVYEELVKEEPRDFRPYLCQGIIYTMLRKNEEAEKKFKQYRRLVPKNHPYAEYFDDNMIATKFFAQKAEREIAGSRG